MLLVRTYVAASDVEGVGVFAAEPIIEGTLIWRFDPSFDLLLPTALVERAAPAVREHLVRYAYPHNPDRSFVVYEIDNGRFMNHSDTPNTDFTSPDRGYANRDIAEGEELLGDYREFWPEYFLLPGRMPAAAQIYTNGSDRMQARRG